MEKPRQECIQDFFETTHKVFHSLKSEVGFPFKDRKLSSSQMRAMFLIAHQSGGVTVKDVAQHLDVTSGAVTQLIDELVENDFVTRAEDPIDRRVIRVTLSKKTRAIFHDLKAKFFRHVEPLFDNLTDQEVRTLRDLIAKVGPLKVAEG